LNSAGLYTSPVKTDDWAMPKDRKKTYSDHQSQAARAKKQVQPKKEATRQDSQGVAKVARERDQRS